MNDSEQNEAKRHFVLKNIVFIILNPSIMNIERKCTKTLDVLDNILQKVTRVYSLVQYTTIVNRMS